MAAPSISAVTLYPKPDSSYQLGTGGQFTVTGQGFTGLTGNNFNVLYKQGGTFVYNNGTHAWGGISITPDPVTPDTKVTLFTTPYSTVSVGPSLFLQTITDGKVEFPAGGPLTPDQIIIGISISTNPNPFNPDAQSSPTTVTYST